MLLRCIVALLTVLLTAIPAAITIPIPAAASPLPTTSIYGATVPASWSGGLSVAPNLASLPLLSQGAASIPSSPAQPAALHAWSLFGLALQQLRQLMWMLTRQLHALLVQGNPLHPQRWIVQPPDDDGVNPEVLAGEPTA